MLKYGEYDLHSFEFEQNLGLNPEFATVVVSGKHAGDFMALQPDYVDKVDFQRGNNAFTLYNMFLDRFSPNDNTGVENSPFSARLVDERIWWKFGQITGRYNIVDPITKDIDANTQKTFRELVTLAFNALPFDKRRGAGSYVAAPAWSLEIDDENIELASQAAPTYLPLNIEWEYENPVQALQSLADYANCVLFCDLQTRTIYLLKNGVEYWGHAYNEKLLQSELGIDNIEKPDNVVIVGSKNIRETDECTFAAVGKRLDDKTWATWGAVDWMDTTIMVSTAEGPALMKPNGEFVVGDSVIGMFSAAGITDNAQTSAAWTLLKDTTWKTYKLQDRGDALFNPYLPFVNDRYFHETRDGIPTTRGYKCTAVHSPLNEQGEWQGPITEEISNDNFSIDEKEGVVKFDMPMFKYIAASGTLTSADITITFPYEVAQCYTYTGGDPTTALVEYFKAPEFREFFSNDVSLNQTDLDDQASVLRDEILAGYTALADQISRRAESIELQYYQLDGFWNRCAYTVKANVSNDSPAVMTTLSGNDTAVGMGGVENQFVLDWKRMKASMEKFPAVADAIKQLKQNGGFR